MMKKSSNKEINDRANQLNRFVEGTNINGNIITDSNIRIDGELIGNLTSKGKLVLGPTGKIEGEVSCSNADIEGNFKGTIQVDGILVLKSTAVFNGNISTHKLAVENGAVFNGNCIMNGETSQNMEAILNKAKIEDDSQIVY